MGLCKTRPAAKFAVIDRIWLFPCFMLSTKLCNKIDKIGLDTPFILLYEYLLVFTVSILPLILSDILPLLKLSHMKTTILNGTKLFAVALSIFLMACGNNSATSTAKMDSAATTTAQDSTVSYDISLVDNKKDPTCGMPVTAGISDTAHYDNKVLGFCSTGCKEEFLKNPKASIAAAELK
jgi:YHS domain-containing protein